MVKNGFPGDLCHFDWTLDGWQGSSASFHHMASPTKLRRKGAWLIGDQETQRTSISKLELQMM